MDDARVVQGDALACACLWPILTSLGFVTAGIFRSERVKDAMLKVDRAQYSAEQSEAYQDNPHSIGSAAPLLGSFTLAIMCVNTHFIFSYRRFRGHHLSAAYGVWTPGCAPALRA
jgi:hypothetical protein